MIIKTLPVAIALALAATASQAQQAMDHSGHDGHAAPADHSQMDHRQMDHSQMSHEPVNHGDMNHDGMPHPPATGVPPEQQQRPPVPTIRDADRAAAFPDLPPPPCTRVAATSCS
jgi:copper resistance protein B